MASLVMTAEQAVQLFLTGFVSGIMVGEASVREKLQDGLAMVEAVSSGKPVLHQLALQELVDLAIKEKSGFAEKMMEDDVIQKLNMGSIPDPRAEMDKFKEFGREVAPGVFEYFPEVNLLAEYRRKYLEMKQAGGL